MGSTQVATIFLLTLFSNLHPCQSIRSFGKQLNLFCFVKKTAGIICIISLVLQIINEYGKWWDTEQGYRRWELCMSAMTISIMLDNSTGTTRRTSGSFPSLTTISFLPFSCTVRKMPDVRQKSCSFPLKKISQSFQRLGKDSAKCAQLLWKSCHLPCSQQMSMNFLLNESVIGDATEELWLKAAF